MRILVAPDSFKGSLSSQQAAAAIRAGLQDALADANTLADVNAPTTANTLTDANAGGDLEIVTIPLSDGGEGFVTAYATARGAGQIIEVEVADCAGNPRVAKYFLEGERAILEVAEAVGIEYVDWETHDVWRANTSGVGQMIADARARGARELIVGLGGSATTDGGIGMLSALGVRFLDEDGAPVAPIPAELKSIARVDTSDFDVSGLRVIAAADVQNPLTGSNGAAAVFGPQKGATTEDVAALDEGLRNLAAVTDPDTPRFRDAQGAGAAGGLGWALMRFLQATITPGFDIIAAAARLDALVAGSDLVITGEGKVDSQTLSGKAPAGIWNLCQKHGVPLVIFGGVIDESFTVTAPDGPALVGINPPGQSLEDAIEAAEHNMRQAARELGRSIAGAGQDAPATPAQSAIILAGGSGQRLGGVSKSDLTIGGERFLDQIVRTLREDGIPDSRIVVVGPDSLRVPEGIALTFEDPPRGGPGAGIFAGLKFLGYEDVSSGADDLVLVTTCDAPFSASARRVLVDAVTATGADAAAVRDRSGVVQQLLAVYRVQGLLEAAQKAQRTHNRAVKKLVAGLNFVEVEVDPHVEIDVDTWEDLKRLEAATPSKYL
ncbi:MAG: glycerate kinase [Actinomycetaceae bacterium]|nr:glycerate kinase [Actinomycetaceae bacterium]